MSMSMSVIVALLTIFFCLLSVCFLEPFVHEDFAIGHTIIFTASFSQRGNSS